MSPTRLAMIPRDGIFCKDGRGWHTSMTGRGYGLEWPWPSTVLGSLRTAWGIGEEARNGAQFTGEQWRTLTAGIRLGASLALRRPLDAAWSPSHIVWPVCRDAMWLRAEVVRLDPVPSRTPTLGSDDDIVREGLLRPHLGVAGKPLAPPRWWTHRDFCDWLAGRPLTPGRHGVELTRRTQVHVGIDPVTGAASESILFSHDVLETTARGSEIAHGADDLESEEAKRAVEWAVGVEVDLPAGSVPTTARLGSDSRLVRLQSLPGEMFEAAPEVLAAFRQPTRGVRIVTVTPTRFAAGWLPDGLVSTPQGYVGRISGLPVDVRLRAAYVSRPMAISGWDMVANRPKPADRMVPPGSVYYFERVDGEGFGEVEARAIWLAALGSRTDEGFGRVVPGVWNPKRAEE